MAISSHMVKSEIPLDSEKRPLFQTRFQTSAPRGTCLDELPQGMGFNEPMSVLLGVDASPGRRGQRGVASRGSVVYCSSFHMHMKKLRAGGNVLLQFPRRR